MSRVVRNRAKKRQKVKEFLNKLKSIVQSSQSQDGAHKPGTLQTLKHVLKRMEILPTGNHMFTSGKSPCLRGSLTTKHVKFASFMCNLPPKIVKFPQ